MTQNNMASMLPEGNTKFKDGVNRNARLIVRNISFKATEEDLREHFSRYGTVEEVKLLRKPDGKLVGCGFVHYTHVPMANKAINATNRKPFLERPIQVSWAIPKHKYGENGNVEEPKTRFNSSTDDEVVVKDEETEKTEEKKDKNKPKINRNARLIVRNISFKATEETLKEHFQDYGDIIEVKLLKKPDGKLVGCAFVHFKNVPMAKKALLNTNMKPFLGRPISVDWAVAKDKYMQHIVNQQLEMQDDVKKEDSDSDDDGPPLNISSEEMKTEVKSESDEDSGSEDDDDHEDKKVKSESSDDNEDSDENEESEEDEDDEEVDLEDDDQLQTSTQGERKRTKLNDAEDGCTVFLTNVPFSVDSEQLRAWVERVSPVAYALVCLDPLTEHSKGSAFVKFTNKDDTDNFLALPADQLRLEGQVVQVRPALKRENLHRGDKKQPKDNRNLYLVKEGVVVAGTKAAVGVSASDMSKRLALERSKTQMLKNLNRFVSRYRVVVSNLPANYDDARLRGACARAAGARAAITEARVMRDLRAPVGRDGKHPSKGYGFVMFTRHEDALACLRKLNNNPDIFDKNNRPIVSFSIEDRTALNARKKRLEKSIANNPIAQKSNDNNEGYKNRKRKSQMPPDESYVKKGRKDWNQNQNEPNQKWNQDQNSGRYQKWNRQNGNQNQDRNHSQNRQQGQNRNRNQNKNEVGKFVRPPRDDADDFTGLTAKEGSQHKMRSNHKLKTQADIHRQTVKSEKKKSKKAMRLKMAAKERVKQPKQKINKTPGKNKRRKFKPTNIRDILK